MENIYIYEYKGVQVKVDLNSVNLIKTNGEYNKLKANSINKMIDKSLKLNHILVGIYKGNSIHMEIDFKCEKHKTSFVSPNHYKMSHNECPKCKKEVTRQNFERLQKTKKQTAKRYFIEEINERGWKLNGEYIESREYVKVVCNNGHKISVMPYVFINGGGCKVCVGYCPIEAEKELKEIAKQNGDVIISKYKGCHSKIKVCFGCCGITKEVLSSSYKNGSAGCGNCTKKGEKSINDFLTEKGIVFIREYRFPQKTISNRRFDFVLPYHNVIIELMGEQHTNKEHHFHRISKNPNSFEDLVKADKEKKDYVESLGYTYIAVDYSDNNINKMKDRFKEQIKPYLGKN